MINHWQYGNTLNLGMYEPNVERYFSTRDTDSEERFNKIQPIGWKKDSFTYKYNSHGFRSREFISTDKPILLAFVCSHTVGVGLPIEYTWPEQLGKYLPDHVVYNAGLGAASSDTVSRLALNIIPLIKPDIVAILWPEQFRFESYESEKPESKGPWTTDIKFDILRLDESNNFNNTMKNKSIIELLQKIHNFSLISFDIQDISKTVKSISYARDQIHNGPEWNKAVAENFYKQYTEKKI